MGFVFQLTQISQCYANQLLLQANDSLIENGKIIVDHSFDAMHIGIGENLYYHLMTSEDSGLLSPSLPLLRWYQAIDNYDFTTCRKKDSSEPSTGIGTKLTNFVI